MGISSGTSTRWLLVHCVQIELEFRNVGFWGEGKTRVPGEKPLGARARTNNKATPHLTPSPGIELWPHWWETSALTTVPSLLPPPPPAPGHSRNEFLLSKGEISLAPLFNYITARKDFFVKPYPHLKGFHKPSILHFYLCEQQQQNKVNRSNRPCDKGLLNLRWRWKQ